MKKSARSIWFNLASLCSTALLLFLLPLAGKFSSSGGIEDGWYNCVFAAAGVLLLNAYALNSLLHEKWTSRLGLYLSSGIAVGALVVLLHFWQAARQLEQKVHNHSYHLQPYSSKQ